MFLLLLRLIMVMIWYDWVRSRRRKSAQPLFTEASLEEPRAPQLGYGSRNRIKTFPPFLCPFLSHFFKILREKGETL